MLVLKDASSNLTCLCLSLALKNLVTEDDLRGDCWVSQYSFSLL